MTTYRTRAHERYAALLVGQGLEFYYREFWVPYRDALSGRARRQYVDFTLVHPDGRVEWVECVRRLVPTDGRICLYRRALGANVLYRCLTPAELAAL